MKLSNPFNPSPAPPAFGTGKTLPERSASYAFHLHQLLKICNPCKTDCFPDWSFTGLDLFSTLDSQGLSRKKVSLIHTRQTDHLKTLHLDLWELPPNFLTASITDTIESNFYSRCDPQNRPRHLRDLQDSSLSSLSEHEQPISEKFALPLDRRSWFRRRQAKKHKEPKYDASLARALHKTFFARIWIAGALKLCSG